MKALAVVFVCGCLLFASHPLWACSTDADCGASGKCVKEEGVSLGICVGGLKTAAPVQLPMQLNSNYVDTTRQNGGNCEIDAQCPQGQKCLKHVGLRGAMYGVCH